MPWAPYSGFGDSAYNALSLSLTIVPSSPIFLLLLLNRNFNLHNRQLNSVMEELRTSFRFAHSPVALNLRRCVYVCVCVCRAISYVRDDCRMQYQSLVPPHDDILSIP
jgi:hypothetical protein